MCATNGIIDMKKHVLSFVAALLVLPAQVQAAPLDFTVREIWESVKSDPYVTLPQQSVTMGSLARGSLKRDAKRTVTNGAHLLPRFDKLLHPTGACLFGSWNVTEETNYGGSFRKGSKGLVIARGSSSLGDALQAEYRGLALALKLFNTMDVNERAEAASVFTAEDVGGNLTPSFLDARMTNEPKASMRPSIVAVGMAIAVALSSADKNPGYRPLYPVGELGPQPGASPRWIQLQAVTRERLNVADFRDELNVSQYPGGKLEFSIGVTNTSSELFGDSVKKIGTLVFTESTASDACDHRLHFPHPKMKE